MLYGHYLAKKNQNISIRCVARSILQRDHATFLEEAEKRWENLEAKRNLKTAEDDSARKKQKGLAQATAYLKMQQENAEGTFLASNESKQEVPWAFLPSEEKQKRRELAQCAWDKAFAICGIRYRAADDDIFREAISKTRVVPDFKLSCSKTMRTTRLDRLNSAANKYKEFRQQAGLRYGFVVTSDGWRSVAKRNYHNYLLISVEGPIFLRLVEVTGAGGTGEDVKNGFTDTFAQLGRDVVEAIVLGITDTPTANRKAWRLLEAEFPKQLWVGCAAHEVSLLFKEWIKKIPQINDLALRCLRVVKWVNNHSEILAIYRQIVPTRFADKRKHCLSLYMPGDTRFVTTFKMLQRILVLWDVLSELVTRSDYEAAAQKALKAWSDNQPVEKKLVAVNGRYPDVVQHTLKAASLKSEITTFIDATKSVVFLLRLVDGQSPVLGKFYYSCALVDKHLRVLQEGRRVSYIENMRNIFAKRWRRWHQPVHTLAYALDPCYQAHELTTVEKQDCMTVIKKLCGPDWPSAKVEFDRWRTAGQAIFPEEVWEAADRTHGYQWWEAFGDDFVHLQKLATKLLSKAISASACEFNWSDVGQVRTACTYPSMRARSLNLRPCLFCRWSQRRRSGSPMTPWRRSSMSARCTS